MLNVVEVLVDVWFFPETLKLSGQPGKRESVPLCVFRRLIVYYLVCKVCNVQCTVYSNHNTKVLSSRQNPRKTVDKLMADDSS